MDFKKDALTKNITIKYDLVSDKIQASTLLNSLLNITAILQEINKEIYPDTMLHIQVDSTSKGSFDVNLSIDLIGLSTSLLFTTNLNTITELINLFKEIINLRAFLGGEKPENIKNIKESNMVEVSNGNKGSITVTQNVYYIYNNNLNISKATTGAFEALNIDENITGLGIYDGKNKKDSVAYFQKDIFSELIKEQEITTTKTKTFLQKNVFVNVFKVVFDHKYKWEFIFAGNRISAYIVDKDFFIKIDKGEKFSSGDTLNVDLEVTQEFNEKVNAYINSSYKVTKVNNHIPRDEQNEMFE